MVRRVLSLRGGVRQIQGFTLVELVVVGAVLVVALSVTLPSFLHSLGRFRLYTAATMLSTNIRQIQQLGINDAASPAIYKATFSPGATTYVLGRNSAVLRVVPLPDGIVVSAASFGGSVGQVRFKGGSPAPDPGGGVVVLRDTQSGAVRSVVIMGATGRVRIQ